MHGISHVNKVGLPVTLLAEAYIYIYMCVCVCVCIYIYIYMLKFSVAESLPEKCRSNDNTNSYIVLNFSLRFSYLFFLRRRLKLSANSRK